MTCASMRPTIAVAVCSYNRNEELSNLLDALLASSAHLGNRAAVGVVVVDDSADGKARSVVEPYRHRFELGVDYRISGKQNISIARNLAISAAGEMADWIAMTDDDCEPVVVWLEALLDTQQRMGVDAVTGMMVRLVPPGSPDWLIDEPFLNVGLECFPKDGEVVTTAATHNSMISSRWLKQHPTIRFQPDLGVVGGEDMVFYRSASAAGLRIGYSRRAIVQEKEPPSRLTLKFQLRSFFWHGNSSYVTNVRNGVSPFRMLLHGTKVLTKAVVRPIHRILHGQTPQLRYCLASVFRAIGMMIGPFGIRVRHH